MISTELFVSLCAGYMAAGAYFLYGVYQIAIEPHRDVAVYDWMDTSESELRRQYIRESLESIQWVKTIGVQIVVGFLLGMGIYGVHRVLVAI